MCTNKKYVTNPYTGQRLITNCGHCPSCLQAKANKVAQRIRNSINDDEVAISITLTYDNKFVPYIKRSDIENPNCYEYPIYRDYTCRRFKDRYIVRANSQSIGFISAVDKETGEMYKNGYPFVSNLNSKEFGFNQDKMGVLLYSDVQDFFKRFRQVLSRDYGLENAFRSFQCSEYGETNYRPHFHTCVVTKRENFESFRSAFFKSWQYADSNELHRCFEEARNMASYLASYVNSNINIPRILSALAKPQHSSSKNFGVEMSDFQLPKILEKTDNRNLTYNRKVTLNGVPTVLAVPIPKYVINRYFPLFKGLCRLDSNTLDCVLRFPYNYFRFHKSDGLTNYVDKPCQDDDFIFKYQNVNNLLTKNESWSNYIRLRHCIDKYIKVTGKTIYDYAIDYQRVWNCYKNTLLRMQYDFKDVSPFELYDNIADYVNGTVRSYSLDKLCKDKSTINTNFNEFKHTRKLTDYYQTLFFKKTKFKKTNSYIYSKSSNNF